jgi:hypothetical protein
MKQPPSSAGAQPYARAVAGAGGPGHRSLRVCRRFPPRRTGGHSPARRPLPIGRLLAGKVPDRGMGPAQVAVLIPNTTPIQKQEKGPARGLRTGPFCKTGGGGTGESHPCPATLSLTPQPKRRG